MRAITEMIGYDVVWVPEDQKVEIWEPSRQHPTIIMVIGQPTAYYEKYVPEIDGVSYEETLDSPPVLINKDFCAAAFHFRSGWVYGGL